MTDKRVTELTEVTTATTDDLLPIVDDPGGTPTLKKITLSNFLTSISGLLTAFIGDSGSGGTKGAVPAPADGDKILLRYNDNGTSRIITHNAQYASLIATMLSATTANKWSYELFEWNATDSKYYCLASGTQS